MQERMTQKMRTSLRIFFFVCILFGLLTSCAAQYRTARVQLNNNSDYPVTEVYLAEGEAESEITEWGENRISSVIEPGGSVTIEEIQREIMQIKVVFAGEEGFYNINTVDLRFTTKLNYNVTLPDP